MAVSLRRWLVLSDHPLARLARASRRGVRSISVPAPRIVVRPVLYGFLALRQAYYTLMRLLVCEPFFKAYCSSYGKRLRTGAFIHFVTGRGKIVLGDDVWLDGKSSFAFAARFADAPLLEIGDRTFIGHQCALTVAKRISIGSDCMLAVRVTLLDSSGHPSDPTLRLAKAPPDEDSIRPITIKDNVWIGQGSLIFPGVTIGEGSIVSAHSVVRMDVPPYTMVAGNPARRVTTLVPPDGVAVDSET